MMRKFIGAVLTVVVLASSGIAGPQRTSSRAVTQKAASQQAPLVAVHVSGSERFKDADILAATGLTIGAAVGPTEFQEAANKLVSSGAFETVEYKFAPAGTGYALTFKVTDNADFMPVTYDNFVWFTDKELDDAVQQRVPLFRGSIASGGEMLDQVTAALQGFIDQHGISGEIKFMQAGELGKSINGGLFAVEGPTIHIKEVKFPGAAEAELPALQGVAKQLTDTAYRKSIASAFAELNLRPIYRERGYLKAQFAEPQIALLDKSTTDPVIAVTIPVTPNIQYKVSQFEWKGVKAFPGEAIISAVKLRPEMIANAVQLDKDIDSVVTLYGTKGYLRATVKPQETFDDAKQTVAYSMQLTEGDVYHVGVVDVSGLDKATNARLRDAWKLREGEPYDTSYEREYMKSVRSMLPPNVSVRVEKQVNDKSHTVDVDMQFNVHADKAVR